MSDLSKTFHADHSAADPEGKVSGRGVAGHNELAKSALGNPELIFIEPNGRREVLFNADVFMEHVHLCCPVCKLKGNDEHGLFIRQGVKDWLYEPDKTVKFPGYTGAQMMALYPSGTHGRLSVEKFDCAWCKTKLAIDKNVVVIA